VLPALGVDLGTLQRLNATGLLLRDQRGLVFRHELARLAVESTIPLGGLGHLHATLLGALESVEPLDNAVLTHHAVAAADAPRAVRYAQAAADEAARAGAHTEAVAFLRIALAHLAGERLAERAALLIALANEQFTTGRVEDAIASVTATFPLWQKVGDQVGLASAHDSCGVFEYYSARRRQAETHADRAAELARDGDALVYGGARLSRAYMATLRNDFRLAHQCRLDGERLAKEHGHEALGIRSQFVAAASDLALGIPNARKCLIDVIEQARECGFDELASTGYSNLCAADVEQRRLQAAERVLEEALAFSAAREIGSCHHWQTGVRSRLRFLVGRWGAALEDADDALTRVGMPLATFWPHLVTGLVQLRRHGTSGMHLKAAWRLAESLDEPLRRLPALAGLAEASWLTGQPDERVVDGAVTELERSLASPAAAWSAGELAVWLKRIGIEVAIDPARVAEPFRLTLTGRHEDAASWWRQAGSSFEEAMTYADGPDPARRGRGIERLDLLGAVAVADRLRLELRQQGFAHVPQRPQARTRANPAGLTNRQLDVAKLVARGFSNAEISSQLFISPKTTEVHVTAVLGKLGVPNRRAVADRASELGLA
jgi:DNA-binding CsgD family transcriptional regulator